MTRLLLAVSVAAAVLLSLAQQNPGEQGCSATAKALGMPLMKEPLARSKQSGMNKVKWGQVTCTYDSSGRVRSIINFGEYKPTATGTPVIKSAAAALDIVRAKLKGSGFALREPAEVSPREPWPIKEALVQVSSSRSAFGKSTHGFAGGVGVMMNRISGKVVALSWNEEFIPDKPVVKIKVEDAVRVANTLFAKIKEPGRAYSTNALLQYFRPTPAKATPAGAKTLEEKKLRYCWIVTLVYGAKLTEMSAPVASVAVDAETSQVLANP